MKKAILYILIFSFSVCCKNENKGIGQTPILGQKDSLGIEKNQDSVKPNIQTKPQKVEIPKEIGIVYVTAESGLTYREKPNINSKKIGKFELGSKLSVIEKTGIELEIKDEQKNIKGEWIKVVSKRYKWHEGYVFSGFVIDSTEADFSKFPIDVSFEFSFAQPQIEYQEIDLKFTETTLSEFNEHQKLRKTENKNYDEPKPFKSVGNPQKGGYFILEINDKLYKFPCGSGYSRPCYTYEGFNQFLNAYSIGQYGNGIYETFYLDKDNGLLFRVNSPYDNGNYRFYVSPTRKRLVSISSIDYERFKEFYDSRSELTIYDIDNVKSFSGIKKAYWYSSKKWEISKVNWVNDETFILEVYDKTKKDDNGMNIPVDSRYLKTTME
ncbi:MAG: SH3 domain-containing protein [Saonia sp.]